MKHIIATIGVLLSTAVSAQQMPADQPNNVGPLPGTEIYLAALDNSAGGYSIGAPHNITKHKGYDNQPYFLPDSSALLYTSEGTDVRTDVWLHTLATGKNSQVTDTPNNSEYSPKVMPDGSGISVIREKENRGGQQVWRYKTGEKQGGDAMLELSPTGYHAWGKGTRYVAVFVLGEPNTLQLVDRSTGTKKVIFENIGRGLFSLPDGSGYTFTEPRQDQAVMVHHFDIETSTFTPLFELPEGNEFYTLMRNEDAPLGVSFFSASGSKIYFRNSAQDKWHEIADFEASGIKAISRLAISPNGKHIAFVEAE